MDNDAFADDQHFELSKIIKRIAREVDEFAYDALAIGLAASERTKTIWDINGNKIGTWEIKGE